MSSARVFISTPLMIDCVPNWCRMQYKVASLGTLARSRSRLIRNPRLVRFHGSLCVLRNKWPASAGSCFLIRRSIFAIHGTIWMIRGRGVRCIRRVLCCCRTITPWSKSTSSHFNAAISPGRAPVYRRKYKTCRNLIPAVGCLRFFFRFHVLGRIHTVALSRATNSSSVIGRRGSPSRCETPRNGFAGIIRCRVAQLKGRCIVLTIVDRVQSVSHWEFASSQFVKWIGRQSRIGRKPCASANHCKYRFRLWYVSFANERLAWTRYRSMTDATVWSLLWGKDFWPARS